MLKEIAVSYTESHPRPGKYSTSTFFASEKCTIDVNTPEEYQKEFQKAFSRVQTIVDEQVASAGEEGRIVQIIEDVRS